MSADPGRSCCDRLRHIPLRQAWRSGQRRRRPGDVGQGQDTAVRQDRDPHRRQRSPHHHGSERGGWPRGTAASGRIPRPSVPARDRRGDRHGSAESETDVGHSLGGARASRRGPGGPGGRQAGRRRQLRLYLGKGSTSALVRAIPTTHGLRRGDRRLRGRRRRDGRRHAARRRDPSRYAEIPSPPAEGGKSSELSW